MRHTCPNCYNHNAQKVLHSKNVIAYQNVLFDNIDNAISTPRGDIVLYFCLDCSFLYNAAFDASLVGYGERYENSQIVSSSFQTHVNGLIDRIIKDHAIINHKILEIGCGNGYFLKQLLAHTDNLGYGFDTCIKQDLSLDRIKFYSQYYDEKSIGNFDVVISRHVVEHICNNHDLIKVLVQKNPHCLYFFETPSLAWIVNNNAFYDVFYEHCSYFSSYSLAKLFTLNNIPVNKIDFIFSGQYLWLEAGNADSTINYKQDVTIEEINKFFIKFSLYIQLWREKIMLINQSHRIAIWGAGAKGVTFANQIDPNKKYIDCVIDINPKKINKFMPGTGHPICAYEAALARGVTFIIVMNPNYLKEIQNKVGGRSIYLEVI